MKYSFTPGPWVCHSGMVYKDGSDVFPKGDNNGIPIASMHREPGNGTVPVERDANAHLIACAPELLTVLNQAIAYLVNPNAFDKEVLEEDWRALKQKADLQIDRKLVICPNASTLGYGKWKAQLGDIIVYQESTYEAKDLSTKVNPHNHTRVARVIGRVAYAPPLESDEKPIRNYLLVSALSEDLTFAMERWVNPEDVIRIYNPEVTKTQNFLAFFFSPEMPTYSADELRQWSISGFSRVEELREYLKRRGAA